MKERYAAARSDGRPLIGGHRGNPAQHPENTLRSFRSALELGCDLIECDVHLSSDGELIVIHDHSLERTTNGTGAVRDKTIAELRSLDAGQGEKLPLLEEVVELVRDRAGLVVELKQAPLPYPGLEEKVVEDLRRLDFVDQASLISFWHPSVIALKKLEPALQCGILEVGRPVDPVALLRQSGADIYSPHYGGCDPELVELVHQAGAAVGVWTVDDTTALAWVRVCRPDSVFTNRPAELGPLLRESGPG